jgi:hypothetical protein
MVCTLPAMSASFVPVLLAETTCCGLLVRSPDPGPYPNGWAPCVSPPSTLIVSRGIEAWARSAWSGDLHRARRGYREAEPGLSEQTVDRVLALIRPVTPEAFLPTVRPLG